MTYWERNGRYERENEKLWNKYILSPTNTVGFRLTNNKNANDALISYLKVAHKYYAFYFSREGIMGMHSIKKPYRGGYYKEYPADEFNKKIAEEAMDKAILRAWHATKEATLPFIGVDKFYKVILD